MRATDTAIEGVAPPGLPARLQRIAQADWFHRFILAAIGVSGLLAGAETYEAFRGGTGLGRMADAIQNLVLLIFVAEMGIKIGAYGARPWRYFMAGWNLFDFAIIVLCLLPLHAEYVVVFRLMRTLRLFTALPGLQVLVSGLLHGIPSLGYVGLLLLLHFYIYAVVGTFAFGDNDPVRFGSLHTSMLTLFQVLTLEGWNDILNTQYHGSDIGYDEGWKSITEGVRRSIGRPIAASAYFVSFILIGTMIILNLFTGVIIRSMEAAEEQSRQAHLEARLKAQRETAEGDPRREELQELSDQLQAISQRLSELQRIASGPKPAG